MYTGRPPLSQNARTECGASARDAARVCVCACPCIFTCAVCLRAPVARILERQLHVVVVVVATRSSHIVPSLSLSLAPRFEINRRRFRLYAKAPLLPLYLLTAKLASKNERRANGDLCRYGRIERDATNDNRCTCWRNSRIAW